MNAFLPVNKQDMSARGWDSVDFLLITGDAYVDHPSFGAAVISRILEAAGYRVGIAAQPEWENTDDVTVFGRPNLGVLITAGNLDSMVNHYTSFKKLRHEDAYSPGGQWGLRPDRACIVYTSLVRHAFKGIPVILGGIEASLRRFAHYDYWTDSVRRSVLIDAKADMLVYGMGERAVREIAAKLAAGIPVQDITDVKGTAYRTGSAPAENSYIRLPDYETVHTQRSSFAEHTALLSLHSDPVTAGILAERTENQFVVQNPPQPLLTMEEMDQVYGLPYARTAHSRYLHAGGVPALSEVKFSLISSRGCFGACGFCSIHMHQGRQVTARSHESLLAEAGLLTELLDFKGYIHDVGGPTANFRNPACVKSLTKGLCADKLCLSPEICAGLGVDHSGYLALLKKLRNLPGVKKVFIRSGLRYDYLLADTKSGDEFLRELCEHHISGQLKVAPEHVSEKVLRLMNKPPISVYTEFAARFNDMNRKLDKKQYLLPYFLTGHPGSDMEAARELARFVRETGFAPDQVQSFLPTPGTLSSCMWHTGLDPRTMEKVYVPKSMEEQRKQKEMLKPAGGRKAPGKTGRN